MIKIIECPRDAMQGIPFFIPTEKKIDYINQLLKVGFDTLDFGSFVSPKAIPQLKDTQEVLDKLDLSNTNTKLLAIIANIKGAENAVKNSTIDYLGYPFSISETFQQRNTNSSIVDSFEKVKAIQELCNKHNKQLVIYISMGFGNPYGDSWNKDIAGEWVEKLYKQGIKIFSLSDTVGQANTEDISYIFKELIPHFSNCEFGAHLHTTKENWSQNITAAYNSGCRRFDAALKGFGGCPMAEDDLVGNLATENLIHFLQKEEEKLNLDLEAFNQAMNMAPNIFESIS